MGAYSSWAGFAVAHHFIVFKACQNLGMNWKTAPYQLLGDDILIGDDKLGEEYISIIESLGVDYSIPKTFKSPHFCEFAKRLIYKGVEITPFPISALKESMSRYYNLVNLLIETERKEWVSGDISLSVQQAYSIIGHKPAKFCKRMRDKAYVNEIIIKMIRDPSLAS